MARLAWARVRQGKISAARESLGTARKLGLHGAPVARLGVVEASLERGMGNWDRALELGQGALRALEEAVGDESELELELSRELARVSFLQGDQASERSWLEKLLVREPRDLGALASRARVGWELADQASVRQTIERLQAPDPAATREEVRLAQVVATVLEWELARSGTGGGNEGASALAERLARELVGVSPRALSSRGVGAWYLVRAAEALRGRSQFQRAEAFLVQGNLAALLLGGPKNPELVPLAQEKGLLEAARKAGETATRQVTEGLTEVRKLIGEKKYRQASSRLGSLRARLPANPRERAPLLGWIRYYQFLAAFRDARLEEAYRVLLKREENDFELGFRHQGYLYSVGTELALRLSRPSLELVRWGSACVQTFEKGGDLEGAVRCARNAATMLELKDEEHRASSFAETLVRMGELRGDPSLVLEGFELLAVGAHRAGRRRDLSDMIPRMDRILARFPLSPEGIERRKKLLQVMTGRYSLASHREEREAFLELQPVGEDPPKD